MIRRTLLKLVAVSGAISATGAARAMILKERKSTLEYSLVNLNGKSIAYMAEGNGVPIVLLHGWPQSSHVWHKIVPFLVANHRVVLIDLPGLGESQSFDVFDPKKSSYGSARAGIAPSGNHGDWVIWATM